MDKMCDVSTENSDRMRQSEVQVIALSVAFDKNVAGDEHLLTQLCFAVRELTLSTISCV